MRKKIAVETASLQGGLTFGITHQPYNRGGHSPEEWRKRGEQTPVGKLTHGGLLGDAYVPRAKDVLSGRFIVPPFSVLNTREGFWQERKRQWISIGIQSEIGRGANLLKYSDTILAAQRGEKAFAVTYHTGAPGDLSKQMKKRKGLTGNTPDIEAFAKRVRAPGAGGLQQRETSSLDGGLTFRTTLHPYDKQGQKTNARLSREAGSNGQGKSVYLHPQGEDNETVLGGTSVFDPVLCELVYRWFAPPNGLVLDPFAGGSVRGVVAGELGLQYVGIDLSARQIEANKKQAKDIGTIPEPRWLNGNSAELDEVLHPLFEDAGPGEQTEFDLLFSCPPYGSLEVYSDDPLDLSTMDVDKFDDTYTSIIVKACAWLKPGAFAVFVIGDYRDTATGFYQNLYIKTVASFLDAGMELYNDIILLNATGSLPLRINAQFNGSRKVGKCHQNVLVFCKGQPKDFVKSWGDVF